MLVLTRKIDQSITLSPRCGTSPRGGDPTGAEAAIEKDLIEITVAEVRPDGQPRP